MYLKALFYKRLKHAVAFLFLAAFFLAAYLQYDYDNWYLSSGDRVLARMNFTLATSQSQSITQTQAQTQTTAARHDAALISLVRNEELEGILSSMRELEEMWNHNYNYPWIFFNNVPFTEEFKARTQAETSAECRYEIIPKEHWDVPEWIDGELLYESIRRMEKQNIKYAGLLSYHQMCRWNSGFFYRHPALEHFRYYWRVEPDVHFFCPINYDPFQFMSDNNKTYGFTINIYDDPKSISSLWPETVSFLNSHPHYLSDDNSMTWLTDRTVQPDRTNAASGYSTCHFWSNFEIADLEFWRSDKYQQYFEHLDQAGGFFYERWGDAPVHSIALGLFEDNEKIHWFRDIAYEHPPYINCPDTPTCQDRCATNMFTHSWGVMQEDCRVSWFKQMCQSRRQRMTTSSNSSISPEEQEICRQLEF